MVILYERQRVSHLFRYGGDWADTTALIGFDPLTDEVHHLLTAQHIPAHSTDRQSQQVDDESDDANMSDPTCFNILWENYWAAMFVVLHILHWKNHTSCRRPFTLTRCRHRRWPWSRGPRWGWELWRRALQKSSAPLEAEPCSSYRSGRLKLVCTHFRGGGLNLKHYY